MTKFPEYKKCGETVDLCGDDSEVQAVVGFCFEISSESESLISTILDELDCVIGELKETTNCHLLPLPTVEEILALEKEGIKQAPETERMLREASQSDPYSNFFLR